MSKRKEEINMSLATLHTIQKISLLVISLAFFGLLTASIVISCISAISSARIDSWLIRAKDAGNPAQVAEFLTNYEDALSKAGRVEGRYSSLFRYPGTYMPVYIRTVNGLVVRASELAEQNSTDTSYQMGLVNLEKDLGDIETAAWRVWVAYHWYWFIISPVSLLLSAIFLFFGLSRTNLC